MCPAQKKDTDKPPQEEIVAENALHVDVEADTISSDITASVSRRVVLIDSDSFAVELHWLLALHAWPLPDAEHILASRDCVASLQHQPGAAHEV